MKSYPIEQEGEVSILAGLAEDDTPRKENLLYLQTINGKKNASLEIISHDLRGIVKHLVDMHQGKIYFESKENKGTTFYVEIPQKSISNSKL